MDKKRVFNGWMFLLALVAVVWIKGTNAKAQDFPEVIPDGEYVTSTINEGMVDYTYAVKLNINKAGYYYFKEKTQNDLWWYVKSENDRHTFSYGKSVWYLKEGTYYIGPEMGGYPSIKVYSADCEFDLSDCQTTFDTSELVYRSEDIVKQWEDNASVVVSLSDGSKFTTSLEGVFLRPVISKGEKVIYGIGRETGTISKNPDFVNKKYILGGDYQIKLMNYTETFCEDSIDIKVVTCSVNSIHKINFDKDIKVSKHSKMALEVTEPSYILIKNITPVFVDSDGAVIEPNYIDYEELVDEEEDIYDTYTYIYISKPQTIYCEYFEEYTGDAAFYQMQESIIKTKEIPDKKYYDEFLYDSLRKVVSCYDIKFESESGKIIQYNAAEDFPENEFTIDGNTWSEYQNDDYVVQIPSGNHSFCYSLTNGTDILNFDFQLYGSITEDATVEVVNDKGSISTVPGSVKYIKINRDKDGDYVLINPNNINEELPDLEVAAEDIYSMGVNRIRNLDENNDYSFYLEIDNTSGKYSNLVFAQLIDRKLTGFPKEIQDVTGSEKASWLKDELDRQVELTLNTTMGDYKVDFNKWGYSTDLSDPISGYGIAENSDLIHGKKFNYVIYDSESNKIKTIVITINNINYKVDSKINNTNNTNTQVSKNKATEVGTFVKTSDATYKITDDSSGKATVAYNSPNNNKKTTYIIPDTVKFSDGTVAKVTKVTENAFKKCKKVKKVTIGKNVEKIGRNAFNGCKNLKTIKIKSAKLTKKSFGKNAFKGINKKATITVPKKVFKNYKKWLKNTGVPKSVKIKK